MSVTFESIGNGQFKETTIVESAGQKTITERTLLLSDIEASVAREIADAERALSQTNERLLVLREKQAEYAALRA